jgi:hypothetical protein
LEGDIALCGFEMPGKIETAVDAVHASSLVLQACAAEDLSPDEALEINQRD